MNKPSNSAGMAMTTPRAVYFSGDERSRAGLDALREGIDNGFVRSRKLTYPQRPKVTLGPLSVWLLGFLTRFHDFSSGLSNRPANYIVSASCTFIGATTPIRQNLHRLLVIHFQFSVLPSVTPFNDAWYRRKMAVDN